MALFANGLLPATFRGAPFAVARQETGGGRRIAMHQYPGREDPWAEDMGRGVRTFRMSGFIVDGDVAFAGGPIQLQRLLLIAALEKGGAGLLTHPTLGLLNVVVTRFNVGEELSAGQMSLVDIEFAEAGKKQFPSLLSQGSGLLSASTLVAAGLAVDGLRAISLAQAAGGRRRDLTTTAARWSSQTITLGSDATALHRLVAQLPGNNGRFAGGGNAGVDGASAIELPAGTTVADLASEASAQRTAITAAAQALAGAISNATLSYAAAIAPAAAALVDALTAACADPADMLRLLLALIAFDPGRAAAVTPLGVAFCRIMRRAACAALVKAVAAYQPASSDDAAAKIMVLGQAIDAAATEAADAGDDASFDALRAARSSIVQDLRTRGATLARIRIFSPGTPLPAVRLAQRYYRDPARADQLVTQVPDAPHPLFMPPTFKALAT